MDHPFGLVYSLKHARDSPNNCHWQIYGALVDRSCRVSNDLKPFNDRTCLIGSNNQSIGLGSKEYSVATMVVKEQTKLVETLKQGAHRAVRLLSTPLCRYLMILGIMLVGQIPTGHAAPTETWMHNFYLGGFTGQILPFSTNILQKSTTHTGFRIGGLHKKNIGFETSLAFGHNKQTKLGIIDLAMLTHLKRTREVTTLLRTALGHNNDTGSLLTRASLGIQWHFLPNAWLRVDVGGLFENWIDPRGEIFLTFALDPWQKNRDGDPLLDVHDQCPYVKGSYILDGCNDPDGDGIIAANDSCPEVPGTPTTEGCPDLDQDQLWGSADRCPNMGGPKELAGCPDTDEDGIANIDDQCPRLPGKEEFNGCPTEKLMQQTGGPEDAMIPTNSIPALIRPD